MADVVLYGVGGEQVGAHGKHYEYCNAERQYELQRLLHDD
jgi:hypothetical protein